MTRVLFPLLAAACALSLTALPVSSQIRPSPSMRPPVQVGSPPRSSVSRPTPPSTLPSRPQPTQPPADLQLKNQRDADALNNAARVMSKTQKLAGDPIFNHPPQTPSNGPTVSAAPPGPATPPAVNQ